MVNEVKEAQHIWFDGVDKRLLEETKQPVPGNQNNLLTQTPLLPYSSFSKNKIRSQQSTSKEENKKKKKKVYTKPNSGITHELAIDCEMVECNHSRSVLARVSIVNLFGYTILDKYVAPPTKVTDYRTRWSGIRPKDLINASSFESVQKEVADIIKGRIVVGHAVHNDFTVLKLTHPPQDVRDTSIYYKYLFEGKTPSLKRLTEKLLGIKIQSGSHDSVQDAQATMRLFVLARDKWNTQSVTKQIKQPPKKQTKKRIKTFFVNTA